VNIRCLDDGTGGPVALQFRHSLGLAADVADAEAVRAEAVHSDRKQQVGLLLQLGLDHWAAARGWPVALA
jgi:hypothetical protein